jgi:SAM-dependent methyltransferase
MDFQDLQGELRRMGDVTRGLAALGAALRLRQGRVAAHPDVDARLADAVAALLPSGLNGLDWDQAAAALNLVTFALEEARDLFERPDRPPAWEVRDPAMLQAQGQASRAIVHGLVALAADRPAALAAALDGRMLDVGTGVAALALEAAAQRPSLRIVGIDIWEPALALARANVAASPHAGRIQVRTQDVTRFDEVAAYTLAWLPAPFLSLAVAQAALDRLVVALAPGGYLVVGLYLPPADAVGAALAALRLTRSGGHVWESSAMEAELSARGLSAVETGPGPPGVTFVLGRRT